jgi:hypothetical protein
MKHSAFLPQRPALTQNTQHDEKALKGMIGLGIRIEYGVGMELR